jgi:MFS family permease
VRQAHIQVDDIGDAQQLFLTTYVTLAPFSTVLGRLCGARNYLVGLVASSGALTVAHAAIDGPKLLFVLRILLGLVQSGFLPTAWFYISGIYPKQYLGFRMCLFVGMYNLAGSFSGLLAHGILKIHSGERISNWQVLFVFDGFLTIFVAFLSLAMLPRSAGQARFLSPMEKRHAERRMDMDTGSAYDALASTSLRVRDFVEVTKDWRKVGIVIFNCLAAIPDAAFGTFLPMVLHGGSVL